MRRTIPPIVWLPWYVVGLIVCTWMAAHGHGWSSVWVDSKGLWFLLMTLWMATTPAMIDTTLWPRRWFRYESIRPPWWSSVDTGCVNPYVCRLLVRVDAVIYWLRGRDVCWLGGTLCERMPKGHGVELRSHFPSGWFIWAASVQNRWFWTRRLLSL